MEWIGTASKSAAVLCLVLACGACSHRFYLARRAGPLLISAPSVTTLTAPAAEEETRRTEGTVGARAGFLDGLAEPIAEGSPRLWADCQAAIDPVRSDHKNYYSWPVARHVLLGISASSVLANTSMDQDFRNWYQDDVKSSGTHDLARAWEGFGDVRISLPATVGLGLIGAMCEDGPCAGSVGEFGRRAARGYLVGGPPMLFMQRFLGASRPGEAGYESRWRPFDDANGVSGHGFVGAVPFITAAQMTDRPLLKGGFYLCSTLAAWGRVDTDSHYLSQASLGWWMAYLACCAVDKTNRDHQRLTFTPITSPDMVGAALLYEW